MSSFTTALIVALGDGRRWRVVYPFTYRVGSKDSLECITVPANFDTDFASVPKILWFLPYWAKYNKPGPLHDYLYKVKQIMGQPITRKRADDIFYESMLVDFRDHRSGPVIAWLEYRAVRLFAWMAWGKA